MKESKHGVKQGMNEYVGLYCIDEIIATSKELRKWIIMNLNYLKNVVKRDT